ncbi:CysZ-like protein [Sulfitobacter sp. THAF37]|uniref:EI24 domain-containing protein n=1 Tax=Sulfitobacter sp. THAF37 TaxID=2587855 RepID=UPI001267C4D2|nr:EI24 domain-containing protein [Sulfitobacter sp. THAF37]QFT58620.1 CysZ-like protein [Sulfitobacter sp. THAF37]
MALGLIFDAFFRALGQLGDPRFRRVFLLGVVLSLVLLIGFTAAFTWLTEAITPDEVWLPILGEVQWIDDLLSWGAAFLLLGLSVFLMIPVASAITSLFLDEVAEAVEGRHYPDLPRPQTVSFGEALRDTVSFLGVLLAANIFAIVLYVIFPPFAPVIFWGMNGFLLGREYFTMVAIRWVGRVQARSLRRAHLATIWAAGTLMAVPLSVPLLNLLVPILGAATFTHLYHGLTRHRP